MRLLNLEINLFVYSLLLMRNRELFRFENMLFAFVKHFRAAHKGERGGREEREDGLIIIERCVSSAFASSDCERIFEPHQFPIRYRYRLLFISSPFGDKMSVINIFKCFNKFAFSIYHQPHLSKRQSTADERRGDEG